MKTDLLVQLDRRCAVPGAAGRFSPVKDEGSTRLEALLKKRFSLRAADRVGRLPARSR